MTKIKFGTDGWRAIIAQEFTVDNVIRVAEGTARWMLKNKMGKAVIGHDCRFAGELFAETTARVLGSHGIKVKMAKGFVSTPMVSLGTVKTKSDIGIVITASHNPASYNGYKLKSGYGGPMSPKHIEEVEDAIPDFVNHPHHSLEYLVKSKMVTYVDLEQMYLTHVVKNFDLKAIKKSKIAIAYDAMYGAGQNIMRSLFPNDVLLNCENNPSFNNQAPEPIFKNLQVLSKLIKKNKAIKLGIANDGDADRIGLFDEDGNFVDSHHILLLLLLYMHQYKKEKGKVVVTFSVTDKMKTMAEKFGLPCEITKVGFKYIAEIMTNEKVLVGGEESGGLAVKGHIPERDGIWIGLMILEFMAKTGKSLKELIKDVYKIVGKFAVERDDLHITEEQKASIIKSCKNQSYKKFKNISVNGFEDMDGYKFILGPGEWVMIRPSGTEPVLRVYAQAESIAKCRTILDATKATILK
jgi:phosphomannomutase